MVVAGAHVGVADQAVAFLPHDKTELGVGLQAHESVDHVYAGPFEFARPRNIGLFVEARFDFDDCEHLFAVVGGFDERVDDRGVTRGAVQGLLDGQHVRVGCRLFDEGLY